ncbi:hypothetical protein [Marinactinospora rubrisoli]|uniref:DUF2079 domain-containing protein n=1 Tax=Marinactinospora rubrisoli TaxID=2715399 RepID=A0ABW2KCB6_9ACTN
MFYFGAIAGARTRVGVLGRALGRRAGGAARRLPAGFDGPFVAGVLLVAASLVLRGYVLRHAYFAEDDLVLIGRAAAATLTVDHLTGPYHGGFAPGAMLLVYALTAVAPYHWPLAAGSVLVLQGLAGLAMFRLLRVLAGRRWATLPPLTVFLAAPLALPSVAWWSAALSAVPYQIAMVLALLWTVRLHRDGEPRYAWWAAGALLVGLAFSERAALLPLLLVAVLLVARPAGGPHGGVRALLAERPGFWTGLAALAIGQVALRLSVQGAPVDLGAVDLGAAAAIVARLLGVVFATGVVGGPLEWGPAAPAGGLPDPAPATVAVAWTVLGALVLAGLRYRRRSWRVWAVLAGYLLVADALPTALGYAAFGSAAGGDPRHLAGAVPVAAVCLALAFRPSSPPRAGTGHAPAPAPPSPARYRVLAAGAAVAFLTASVWSTHTYVATLADDRVRSYLGTARSALRSVPEEAGVYPRPVPDDIVHPWNGSARLSSVLLSPLAPDGVAARVADPRPAAAALVFDDSGRLVPAGPAPGGMYVGPPEDEDCVATVDGRALWPVETTGGPTVVATLAYTADSDTQVTLGVGGALLRTALPAAPEGGTRYVPLGGSGDRLLLEVADDEVCLHAVTLGELAPVGG